MRGNWPGGRRRRVGLVVLGVLLGTVLPAGRAAAHVEVSSEPAVAGAPNAVVTFTAEAESDRAGIRAIQVQLPQGIAPADATWESGPPGWTLTANADGYEVSGPPLPVGQEARYAVRVRQLPNAPSVAFKTVQHYTDGQTDRWIGLPEEGSEVDNPAPVITLSPAAAAPASTVTSTSSSSTQAPSTPAAAPTSANSGGLPTGVWFGLTALVVALLVLAALVVRRRHRGLEGSTGG